VAQKTSRCGSRESPRIGAAGKTFMVRTMLDFTGCTNCELQIEGILKASDDTNYWSDYRQIISVNSANDAKIRSVTGSGIIDGNGQAAWDRYAQDSSLTRPILFRVEGKSKKVTVANLLVKNSPSFFFLTEGDSVDTLFQDLSLTSNSKSEYPAKNTDGIDIGKAKHTTLRNITIQNQDDCVAFKPGADYVIVDGIHCKGSHGISVGSLGKGIGKDDTVTNVYVRNAIMDGATKGVGIKLYPGAPNFGTAYVKNITWEDFTIKGAEYAVQIQSCYNKDYDYCETNPTTAVLQDIKMRNFKGTTGTKHGNIVANMNCPVGKTCGITFEKFDVKSPSGERIFL
ncbi:pectin lyase-like protein, partial [Sarocladium strictum]